MNFGVAVVLFLLLFVSETVFSQETLLVSIVPSSPVAVVKGQAAQLSVKAKIKKGFHIQANPASDEFLIPTTLTLQASKAIVSGKPTYPPGRPYRLKGSTIDLLTYKDEVTIKVPVRVMDATPAGKASLIGKLDFQPCNNRKCLFPRSVPVLIPVQIVHLLK